MRSNGENAVWKIILSVCISIFLMVRIAVKCSGNGSNSSRELVSTEMSNLHKIADQSRERAVGFRKEAWKNIFDASYEKMDSLGLAISDVYGIRKLEKDSLLRLDLKTKIRIPKGSFFYE